MLTDYGRRMLLEQMGPLHLYRCAEPVDDGPGYEVDAPPRRVPPPADPPAGPLPVRLPDGTVTEDVPLDVRCEPVDIGRDPGAYFLGWASRRPDRGVQQVGPPMTMLRGDSFTIARDTLMKAIA